ncbi:MAG: Na+/H+ antiporter NhaA [Anaerolineae bacterium]|nr:Na+/H+ antiporter NhaA [Anaerolineae bacterium]
MTKESAPRLVRPVSEPRDHIMGRADAPVTLVEYGDYECPHCRQVNPVIAELQEALGDRLRYVFRHFPIRTSHVHAQLAAEAAEAAGAQGKYWEMHALLLDHQDRLERADLLRYAAEIGLDVARFEQALDDHTHQARVREDFTDGVRSGVNGTPTFFINGARYDGAWDLESLLEAIEKPLGVQVRLLAQEFQRLAAAGGIVLMIATVLALLWANLPGGGESYDSFWHTNFSIALGDTGLSKYLLKWVNDGLMAIFFFVVGLEIKREVTTGELANPRRAALPIIAAIGGLLTPAAIYALINAGGDGAAGWGIPMATDIAFMLGVMALLGSRVPLSLKVFFTAIAIVDDIGAVLVIALFYTEQITVLPLVIGAVMVVLLLGLNRARVYSPLPYALLGLGLWLAFLQSGVHPTIAGVLLALTIPTRSPANTGALLAQCVAVLDEFEDEAMPIDRTARQEAAAQTLETVTERLQSPAQRLEHNLHPWSTFLILPIFALANAGVQVAGEAGMDLFNPVSLGIILGLVLGKPLGITAFSWLAVRLGLAEMPRGVNWPLLFSGSWLAGIGFTISLFIANDAFGDPALTTTAKLGILIASILAGVIGFILLRARTSTYREASKVQADAVASG